MAMVDITGFERRRREQAAQEAENDTNVPQEELNAVEGEKTGFNVEDLTIDEVKAELEAREIKFSHNTGEAKLREKLANAIA